MSTAIEVSHLAYTYPGVDDTPGVAVFEDMNLTITEGSFVAVLGGNGCGKSTLAKHFNSILLPCGGKVYVCGMDTADEEMTMTVRRNVGMVFQNPDNQIVANVVEEDVAFGPENLGVASPVIRQRVDNALKQVGMYEYREHAPHLLSGGQKQRIAIAGIIAMQPECMIFDESTAMLDPAGRRDVIHTIEKLNRERGITVIAITHYMNEAARADRVIIINDGQVAMDGTPEEIFRHGESLAAYGLDVPQGTALIHRLRERGISLPGDCTTPEQCAQTLYNALSRTTGGTK